MNYEESDDDDDDDDDEENESNAESVKRESSTRPTSRRRTPKSLIVTLKCNTSPSSRSMRPRRGSRAGRSGQTPTPTFPGARRSSRLSNDDAEGLFALTNSGKHAEVVRKGSRSPSAEPVELRRPSRGGKGPIKMPSAIMEASQETSQKTSQLAQAGEGGEGGEEEQEAIVAESAPNSQSPVIQAGGEGDDEAEHIVMESNPEDDDDDDEGPVTRRNLRVCRALVSFLVSVFGPSV